MPLDIQTQTDNNSMIVRLLLTGSLDSVTAPEFDAAVSGIIDNAKVVVLNMKFLDYISSAGIRSVFKLVKAVKANGGKVATSNRQPQVEKVFDIIKALPDMQIFANDQEMDEYLDVMQQRILNGDDF